MSGSISLGGLGTGNLGLGQGITIDPITGRISRTPQTNPIQPAGLRMTQTDPGQPPMPPPQPDPGVSFQSILERNNAANPASMMFGGSVPPPPPLPAQGAAATMGLTIPQGPDMTPTLPSAGPGPTPAASAAAGLGLTLPNQPPAPPPAPPPQPPPAFSPNATGTGMGPFAGTPAGPATAAAPSQPPAAPSPPQAAPSQAPVAPSMAPPARSSVPAGDLSEAALNSIPEGARSLAQQAAQAGGLPPEAFPYWVSAVHNESQWNLREKDGAAGEIGPGQVMPETGKEIGGYTPQQLRDPLTNLTASAQYFAQKWKQSNGGPEQSLTGYNTGNVNGSAPSYVAHALGRVNAWGVDGLPSQARQVSSRFVPASDMPPQGAGGGFGSFSPDIQRLIGQLQPVVVPRITASQQLMALASGLLGGRSFGQGLSKGIENVNELTMADRQGQVQQAQLGNQQTLAKAGLLQEGSRMALEQERMAALDRPRAIGTTMGADGKTMLVTMQDPRTGQTFAQPLAGGLTPQAARTQGTLSGQTAENGKLGNENAQNYEEVLNGATSAKTSLQTLANLQQIVKSGGATPGSTLWDRAKRDLATSLGVNIDDTDGSSVNLAKSIIGAAKSGQVGSLLKGTGLRTQREFDTMTSGLANLDRDPATLGIVVGQLQKLMQFKADLGTRLSDPATKHTALVANPTTGVNDFLNDQENRFWGPENNQTAATATTAGTSGPTIQKGPGGWQTTPGGVKFQVN